MDGNSVQPGSSRCKAHILVVDDDVTTSEILGHTLRRAGFDVSLATDFQRTLEILEGGRPVDVLVADIVMPSSVNGIAISRMARLRQQNLKVIYISGYSVPGADREALGPILRKPIDDHELIREIELALEMA